MDSNILALDIGQKRIGVARANIIARIPTPVATLLNDKDFTNNLKEISKEYEATTIVVGLPRNLQGSETKQTAYVKEFVAKNLIAYKVIWQDETLSTVKAQERFSNINLGIDAEAARVILEDYLNTHNDI